MKTGPAAPVCDYCGNPAVLVRGSRIYPRRPDLVGKFFWECSPCDAWVGTHANSKDHIPLGRLANAELRAAKIKAHAAFDRLWKAKHRIHQCSKKEARGAGYKWLAEQLGISRQKCHIGNFSIEDCRRVVQVCEPYIKERAA